MNMYKITEDQIKSILHSLLPVKYENAHIISDILRFNLVKIEETKKDK